MKRSCKHIDITDWRTTAPWVAECILRHRTRHDIRDLVRRIGGVSRQDYKAAIRSGDKRAFYKASERIAQEAARRIRARQLGLAPVRMREQHDRSTNKLRLIGKESAMQLILDTIADKASEEVWKRRVVPQQASSIKKRGPLYGAAMIAGWVKADGRNAGWAAKHGAKYSRKCKYFVKLDIAKCYQSMRCEVFMERFRRDCANEDLTWLWEELLKSHRVDGYEGFMIGAPTSQSAAQYLISFLYRYVMGLHKERRGKEAKLVSHALMYMDDILLIGPDRRNLKMAVRKLIRYAKDELGLTIKPSWQICRLDETPVDMMGCLIHADGAVTLRPRVFLRTRRIALRIIRGSRKLSLNLAQRICSYKGYFVQKKKKYRKLLRSRRIRKKLRLDEAFKKAAKTISNHERRRRHEGNLQQRAGSHPVHATA